MAEATRERILEAGLACVARVGMARTTMEDIAKEAGLSRATLYRTFPGGRDELLEVLVTWEVARFFVRLNDAIAPEGLDLGEVLERGFVAARDLLEQHELLQHLLREEADQLVPSLATVMPLVAQALADWFRPLVEAAPLRPGVVPQEAAELVARLALSYLGTPGRWDLHDPDAVHRLVHQHLLAALV